MDSELLEFISHLDDDVPLTPYPQLNAMWADLEEYFDQSYFDIDQFLNELLHNTQPSLSATIEENVTPITGTPQQVMTVDELLKNLTITDTFYNDLITIPALDVDAKVVTDDILLDTIRSHSFTFTGRQYEHPFGTLASINVSPMAPLRNDFSLDIAPPRNDFSSEIAIGTISSKVDWFAVLSKQHLRPGITAEGMAKNMLQSESNLPAEMEVVNVIALLFNGLNNYIDKLSAEFGDQKFFDDVQLDALARELQEKILTQFNGQTTRLRDVLHKWMRTVTETFVQVNDQRRRTEEKVSNKIIDKAVEVYRSRLITTKRNEDKERDIIRQGIRHVYANCGVDFIENVLKALDERLKEGNFIATESTVSGSSDGDNWTVLIKLLASEYVSNVNQKGLQCAGISKLKQFDDVNATCLKDILHDFDRKTVKLPLAQRDQLKKQLISMVEYESNGKRSEFRQRLSASSAVSSGVSFADQRSHSVGIHFGFETMSVSCYDHINKTVRTVYGPAANVVSFTNEGISIGPIPTDACSLNVEDILTNTNADRLYDTKFNGELAIDSIIALMLMFIDEIVKQTLHVTSRIKYAVAIPSCLNDVMQHIFKTAFNIADINCSLVREQCAISANFIRENHQSITKNNDELLVTMIVKGDACDSVLYEIAGGGQGSKKIVVLSAGGSEAGRTFYFTKATGLQFELEKIQRKQNKIIRFLVCNTDHKSITQIKNQFSKSKVHLLKFDSNDIADGAALLSYVSMDGNPSLDCSLDLRSLSFIKRLTDRNSGYRLTHKSMNAAPRNLQKIRPTLRSIIDDQLNKLAQSKAATKRFIMDRIKDLDESNLRENEKDQFRRLMEKDLKVVDEEFSDKLLVDRIADSWNENRF